METPTTYKPSEIEKFCKEHGMGDAVGIDFVIRTYQQDAFPLTLESVSEQYHKVVRYNEGSD